MKPWPPTLRGISYGGDYNPEQWPEQLWDEDIALMRECGVDLVTVGVFSWALLEPSLGVHEWGWLDQVLDRLHTGGIRVDLATATASPPPWLSHRFPEILPETREGHRLWPGGRQAYCPSSPIYREHALALTEAMATRYGGHPSLALWHVSNELGGHNAHCYCEVSAEAFRRWLQARYGDLDTLNDAWGTTFWSQRYGDWQEILPPRLAPTFPNPTQQLDFHRFSSDAVLRQFCLERDVLHRITPSVPVTTNFMVMEHVRNMDYWAWAREVDVISNDHYLDAADPRAEVELAFSADLTRGLARGRPWILMEHSSSAVNWQPRNVAKQPGQMRRNSLQHVARGADAVLFFQWRAAQAGAEKYHSALVPHAGRDSRVWREVVELGAHLDHLDRIAGSTVRAQVAMVFDWEARWAAELDSHPSIDVTYLDRALALYRSLWDRAVTVDFVHPEADLSGYRVVLVPTLYLTSDAGATNIAAAAARGASVLVTYWSGIVDESDHVRLGGYPGAFRDLLGIRTEEFFPLRQGESVRLDDGSSADVWTELLHAEDAEVLARYVDGPLPGIPAITRRVVGAGSAWYVATRLEEAATGALLDRVLAGAEVRREGESPAGVELVRRLGAEDSHLFIINHTGNEATVAVKGTELISGSPVDGKIVVPAAGVAVIHEAGG